MKHKPSIHPFVLKYPLSLREIAATPGVFRENNPGFKSFAYPNTAIIRDLAAFAGYGYGALRTALTRFKSSGEIESFVDKSGITRFRLTSLHKGVSNIIKNRDRRPEGFLIAVFSFKKDDEKERREVRDTLRYFGFKRIAQNTYINGMIDQSGLKTEMKRAGVDRNLYLFQCPEIDDTSVIAKLKSIFDIKKRSLDLKEFVSDLKIFLEEPGQNGLEFGRRVFYSGPVYTRKCFVEEPPLPQKLFPKGYPLGKIETYFGTIIESRITEVIEYYRGFCERK
jgi:DNA-binding transcriptional regulator PaaX